MQRRHDIDALRVLAFALLILYHVAMVYVADWGYHVKSDHQAGWLQWPMIALNRWRMPLLFLVSGIAIGLARPGRDAWRFAGQRSWRLLLPLAFGMFAIVPVQAYCEALASGRLAPGFWAFLLRYWQLRPWPAGTFTGAEFGITWNHLWYLAYLWPYTLLLLALAPLGRTRWASRLSSHSRWPDCVLVLPLAWLLLCEWLLAPRYPKTGAFFDDWAVHAQSLPLFMLGYAIAHHVRMWERLRTLRHWTLAVATLAVAAYLALIAADQWLVPARMPAALRALPWPETLAVLRAAYTWTALLAILGWGQVLLDRPFRWLPYATEAIFSWYILHQSLIVPLAFYLKPLQLGPFVEPLLVLGGTVAGCILLHEYLIRRSGPLRPLFGLKRRRWRPRPRDPVAVQSV